LQRTIVAGANAQAAVVLIASRQEGISAAVSEHLSGLGVSVYSHALQTAIEIQSLRELLPDIAFVDYDAMTADNFPLHKALSNAVPDCQVILLCTREQADEAARLVRVWEVFDYLLTDFELDPSRIRLLAERAQMDKLPSLSEIRGFAKLQYRRILELLGEIKSILKTDCSSPVVKAIHEYKHDSRHALTHEAFLGNGLAAEYKSHVIDFICGKLRRLEHEIYSIGEQQGEPEECGTADSVLLVEDDLVSAELARGLLERNGFYVIVAKTGDAAIHELVRQRPSLVLMDIHLGSSDGLHVVKMMRSRSDLQDIPVIIVTSDRHRDTLFDAIETRVQGYLLKPYQPKEFIEKVKNVLHGAQAIQFGAE
jgi:DNA-binding response OmpR family regulator